MSENTIQVGWYCNHGSSHYDAEKRAYLPDVPHREWKQKSDGSWKSKKRESVITSLSHFDGIEPDTAACRLAVPILIPADSATARNFASKKSL